MKNLSMFLLMLITQALVAQDQDNKIMFLSPEKDLLNGEALPESQKKFIQNVYQSVIDHSSDILNGREYKFYFSPKISSPLLPENPIPTASITIQNRRYDSIILLYDTYKDLVIYYDQRNYICPIVINRYIIDEFSLHLPSDHLRFKYLEFPESMLDGPESGFYEITGNGKCQLYIKHQSKIILQNGRDTYKYGTERYIAKDGKYFLVKGKKGLLNIFADRSAEVKGYLKRSKIRVRRADKEQLRSIIDYYNSLLQP